MFAITTSRVEDERSVRGIFGLFAGFLSTSQRRESDAVSAIGRKRGGYGFALVHSPTTRLRLTGADAVATQAAHERVKA
jgi:hypothetical protein